MLEREKIFKRGKFFDRGCMSHQTIIRDYHQMLKLILLSHPTVWILQAKKNTLSMLSLKLKSLLILQNSFKEVWNQILNKEVRPNKIKMIQTKRIDLVPPGLNLMTKISKKWCRQQLKELKQLIYRLSHYLWMGHSVLVHLNIQKNSISVSIRSSK